MAKDHTKYNVKGLGEKLAKGKAISKFIADYVTKNNLKLTQVLKEFPDSLHG